MFYQSHVLIPIECSLMLGNVIKNTTEKVEQLEKQLSAIIAKYKGLVHCSNEILWIEHSHSLYRHMNSLEKNT